MWINNEPFFVCNATGLLLKDRYFIPGKRKHGAFVTLPIALRWIKDNTNLDSDQFEEVKRKTCVFFCQPDIPLHPTKIEMPAGHSKCKEEILNEMELGRSWLFVQGSENISEYLADHSGGQIQKKAKSQGSQIDEAWLTLFT